MSSPVFSIIISSNEQWVLIKISSLDPLLVIHEDYDESPNEHLYLKRKRERKQAQSGKERNVGLKDEAQFLGKGAMSSKVRNHPASQKPSLKLPITEEGIFMMK